MDVEEVMSRDVVSVGLDTSLREIAALLSARRISGVPVVDHDGAVVGVVSGTDILVKGCMSVPPRRRLRRRADFDVRIEARTAREAMSSPAVCIEADRPLWEAADLMVNRNVDRLPVLSRGELVGIVTRADLVRAFVRTDREIEDELAEILAGEGIDVEVEDGEAVLRGVVAGRTAAADAVLRASRVPGIVAVSQKLIRGR